jgi:hypothetical protein
MIFSTVVPRDWAEDALAIAEADRLDADPLEERVGLLAELDRRFAAECHKAHG